jgi:hypothetical protein
VNASQPQSHKNQPGADDRRTIPHDRPAATPSTSGVGRAESRSIPPSRVASPTPTTRRGITTRAAGAGVHGPCRRRRRGCERGYVAAGTTRRAIRGRRIADPALDLGGEVSDPRLWPPRLSHEAVPPAMSIAPDRRLGAGRPSEACESPSAPNADGEPS